VESHQLANRLIVFDEEGALPWSRGAHRLILSSHVGMMC
jgi:hypothetical protein